MKKLSALLFLLSFSSIANVNCDVLDKRAQDNAVHFENSNNGFSVIGKDVCIFTLLPT